MVLVGVHRRKINVKATMPRNLRVEVYVGAKITGLARGRDSCRSQASCDRLPPGHPKLLPFRVPAHRMMNDGSKTGANGFRAKLKFSTIFHKGAGQGKNPNPAGGNLPGSARRHGGGQQSAILGYKCASDDPPLQFCANSVCEPLWVRYRWVQASGFRCWLHGTAPFCTSTPPTAQVQSQNSQTRAP